MMNTRTDDRRQLQKIISHYLGNIINAIHGKNVNANKVVIDQILDWSNQRCEERVDDGEDWRRFKPLTEDEINYLQKPTYSQFDLDEAIRVAKEQGES